MTTNKKASKAGVRRVTASIDNLATLVQHHYASLGLPKAAALDFATRCDMLSDFLDKRRTAGYFDPSEIAVEVPGPQVFDSNNPFMQGHFTQGNFRQLDEKQLSGELASNAAKHIADPKLAKLVHAAAYKAAMQSFGAMKKAAETEEEKAEDEAADEAEEAEDDDKAEKTAMMAELYNRLRREAKSTPKSAKKAEDEEEAEEEKETEEEAKEEAEDAEEESKKVASAFGLYA
jgi:hypothetical protein